MKAKHLLKCVRALNARVRVLERSLCYTRQRLELIECEVLDRGQIIPASLITRHRPCADRRQGDD